MPLRLPRAAAVAAALALAACKARPPAEPAPSPPGEAWLTDKQVAEGKIGVEPAGPHAVGVPVVAPARIAFDDLEVAHVFSPVAGRVLRVLAQPGDRVRRGAPLAVIQSPEVGQALLTRAFLPPLLVIAHRRFHPLRSEAAQPGAP
jgi:cobalt-zinc-cadmium efflux system membrane fusion protein